MVDNAGSLLYNMRRLQAWPGVLPASPSPAREVRWLTCRGTGGGRAVRGGRGSRLSLCGGLESRLLALLGSFFYLFSFSCLFIVCIIFDGFSDFCFFLIPKSLALSFLPSYPPLPFPLSFTSFLLGLLTLCRLSIKFLSFLLISR